MKIILCFLIMSPALWAQDVRHKMAELHELREQIRKQVFDRGRQMQETHRLTQELSLQAKRIQDIEKNLNKIKDDSRKRLITLYKMKRQAIDASFLSLSKDKNYFRKSQYFKIVNRFDHTLAENLKLSQRQRLKEKNQFEKRLVYLAELRKKNTNKLAILKDKEKQKRELIALIKDMQKTTERTATGENNDFASLRGSILGPIEAVGVSHYGLRRDPETAAWLYSSGVFYSTEAKDIKSVGKGVVRLIEKLPFWGPTLVLDHGEDFLSVYTNIKNLSVSLGDSVIDGQKLAEVGDLKYDDKYNFYFEIRQFTEPQNPKEWFKTGAIR